MNHKSTPNYELDDVLELTTTEQFSAIGDPTRGKILGVLGERAATNKQLAAVLQLPKGTVAHHLRVLESAGLIKVVATRRVRAIMEKYYGRVARTSRVSVDGCEPGSPLLSVEEVPFPFNHAFAEMRQSPDDGTAPNLTSFPHGRMSEEEAREFVERLRALTEEFRNKQTPGGKVYGLIASLYLTDWPDLSQVTEADDNGSAGPERAA